MNDDLNEFNIIIKNIQEIPHTSTPVRLTENVMDRINGDLKHQGFFWMMNQAIKGTSKMSFRRIHIDETSTQATGFYFLLAGLFFFLIGATLLNSLLYMPYLSHAAIFIMIQSLLVLMASFSLVAPGMMLMANIPHAEIVARRAIMIFTIFIIACALFLNETVKTTTGGLVAASFAAISVLMGIILLKSVKNKQSASGVNNTLTGELHHV